MITHMVVAFSNIAIGVIIYLQSAITKPTGWARVALMALLALLALSAVSNALLAFYAKS